MNRIRLIEIYKENKYLSDEQIADIILDEMEKDAAQTPDKAGVREGVDELAAVMWDDFMAVNEPMPKKPWAIFRAGFDAAIRALAPTLTGAEAGRGVVPAGWKLVPEMSTEKMDRAGMDVAPMYPERIGGTVQHSGKRISLSTEDCRHIYTAMLAATPTPPVSPSPDSMAPAGATVGERIRSPYYVESVSNIIIRALGEIAAQHGGKVTSDGLIGPQEFWSALRPRLEGELETYMLRAMDGDRRLASLPAPASAPASAVPGGSS